MSWSFVGSVITDAGAFGTTTATVNLPAGVQGGDLVVVGICFAPTTAPGYPSIPGFTVRENFAGGAKSANFGDFTQISYKTAGGAVGSGTTDTSYTVTYPSSSWSEHVCFVWRPGTGAYAPVSSAHYNGNSSGVYSTACPDPTYTPTSASNLTVWGYAGQNSTVGTPATSFSGTGPSALTNFGQDGGTGNGGGIGIGWLQSTSPPGGATASQAVDAMDFVLEFAEVTQVPPPLLVQPGGKQWRRKFRHRQVLLPVAVNPNLTVNAGLATAAGAALDNTNASGLGIGFTAALAPAASAAGQPNLGINTGLATGTGSAGSPSAGVNAGLATGTGAAFGPATAVNTGLATGTGTAGSPNIGIDAGLATGTGSSAQPGIAWTPGLASAIGAAGGLSMAASAGLATATGAAAQPGTAWTPGLATGTGAAGSPNAGINAGLATAIGAAAQPATPRAIGLATGTGAASLPNTGFNIGLATGTGTAFNIPAGIPAGLATAIGTAFGPATAKNIGLATGIGAAGPPAVGIYAGLATAIGAAAQPGIAWTAILAHGTGTAAQPAIPRIIGLATGTGSAFLPFTGFNIGLATGTGTAFNITRFVFVRHNVDYTGSTLTAPNTLGGTLSVFTLGGTLSVANTLGGTATVTANTLGGTTSVFTLGGTLAVTPDPLTGTLSVAVNTLSGTTVEDKMQEIDITLNEYNDATVTFQILNNGSPDNITGMTVQALFKKTRGDLDSAPTTKTYSSSGGSPAITINTPTTGSCTWAVPDADVIFGNVTFYRIDVVSSGLITTAIFGTVTVTQL